MTIIGIDISKKTFDAALLLPGGPVLRRKFPNKLSGFCELLKWAQSNASGSITVAMEATGTYGEGLALFCFEAGWQVHVINPARIKAYAVAIGQKNKTDRADSETIAQFAARTPDLTPWVPLNQAQAELRALVRERIYVQNLLQAEQTRAQTAPSYVQAEAKKRIQLLESQRKALLSRIRKLIKDESALARACELLSSIRGIGFWTAAVLLAELPPITRTTKTRQIASLFGLCPSYAQSGTSVCKRRARGGRRLLSHQLYMPALVAMRRNPIMAAFAERLKTKGKAAKQIIAAVLHRLVRVAVGVLKSGQPFDPNWSQPA